MSEMLGYRAGADGASGGFISRRWGLLLVLILASFGLDVLLALVFAAPGSVGTVMPEILGTFVLGPFCTYRLLAGVDVNPLLACLSFSLILGHPIGRNWVGAAATVCGVMVWWGLAWRVILSMIP